MNRLTQKKQKARNFARAFLRTHEMSEEKLFSGIDTLTECCRQNPLAFHLLELSSAHIEQKYRAIDALSQRFGLPWQLAQLLRAVLRYKEFHLLTCILAMLKEEFKKMHGIHEVVVSSSHPLLAQDRKDIELLVQEKIPGTLRFMYQQDRALIAGIKIETPLYYWEHSVARTMRTLQQQIESQE